MGPFFLNLNQTGEQDDLTRVEVFSYTRNLTAMAEMVTSEAGNSKVRRAYNINLMICRTAQLKTRPIPMGKVLIFLVDAHGLGNLIEAAQQSEAPAPMFDKNDLFVCFNIIEQTANTHQKMIKA